MGTRPEQKGGWGHKKATADGHASGRHGNHAHFIKRQLSRLRRRRMGKRDPEAPTKKLTRGWE